MISVFGDEVHNSMIGGWVQRSGGWTQPNPVLPCLHYHLWHPLNANFTA
jgi:hypothetical protein